MESESREPRVYVVHNEGDGLVFKSSRIHRESEMAVYLETALLPPGGYYVKRLLIKGRDPIARSEEEALRLHVEQLRMQLAEVEKSRDELLRRLEEAAGLLRRTQAESPAGLRG